MTPTCIYPVILTSDVPGAAAFFRELFGFETTFATDWYASLRKDARELGILNAQHESVPTSSRGVPAQGVLLDLQVDDVDAEYDRIRHHPAAGELVQPLASESYAVRHFVVRGPEEVLVDVLTPIAPDEGSSQDG